MTQAERRAKAVGSPRSTCPFLSPSPSNAISRRGKVSLGLHFQLSAEPLQGRNPPSRPEEHELPADPVSDFEEKAAWRAASVSGGERTIMCPLKLRSSEHQSHRIGEAHRVVLAGICRKSSLSFRISAPWCPATPLLLAAWFQPP